MKNILHPALRGWSRRADHRFFRFALYLIPYIFCLFSSFSLHKESFGQDVKFTRIGTEDGLSQVSVNCILQDSKGYMWFGTQDGLNQYNGYEMKYFKNDPTDSNSISHNWIDCLYEDTSGTLWIGTRGGGLNALNVFRNHVVRYENDAKNENSLSGNNVKCIYRDRSGTYWVGTTFGLNAFNGKTNHFVKYIHQTDDTMSINGFKVETIYEDKKGRLWIGTYDGGLNLFDRAQKIFIRYIDKTRYPEEEFNNRINCIRSIAEDESGILYLATDGGGVVLFNPETKKFFGRMRQNPNTSLGSISENYITSVVFDNKRTLWLGTKDNGITCINRFAGTLLHHRSNQYEVQSLSNDGVRCIYKDREGNIWLGTDAGGVSVHFPNAAKFRHYRSDIVNEKWFKSNTVFAILQDKDGLLWLGTMYGGITTFNRTTSTFNNYGDGNDESLSSAKSNSILSLFEDKDGLIWVGTWGGGLNTYDKVTGKITRILDKGAITCIVQGHESLVWFGVYGSDKGLFAYNKETGAISNYTTDNGLSSNNIYCVYEDKKNRFLWIGTADRGLNMLDIKTGKVKIFQHDNKSKNSISNNTVNSIWDDRKGNLYLGTSNGLNKLDLTTFTFTAYYEKDGLPNANIWGILGDKRGNLWLSTNKGLSRFNPNIENIGGSAFKNFTPRDGLQGEEFSQGSYFLNKKTGEMFFGGLNGVNSFEPDNIIDNKHIPPVFITSFKKFGKDVVLDTTVSDKKYIELSYKDNFISFEFVALDYIFPEKNKYSFTMDGLDDDWSPPTTRRYVSYTNLPGGNYTFRVRAANSDGLWNTEGATIRIKIIPPWWKTNTFYAFAVIFSIAFVFAFIRFRTAAIEKEKKILEQKVQERTLELAQKNKDITSSIQYAKRIQDAILPEKEQIHKYFPESFVFFKPKDIVSGDFYWFGEKGGRKIACCVDCTGHGVPGAFMSMIGVNFLNQIILEKGITEPAAILSSLDAGVRSALKQGVHHEIETTPLGEGGLAERTTDGMDMAICSIEEKTGQLFFSGALRHILLVSGGKVEKIEGNKFPIGGAQWEGEKVFTSHQRFLKTGDTLYMFSDGYADQFGGDKGKKFMLRQLNQLLFSIRHLPLREQQLVLEQTLADWQRDEQQVDDILVMGIKI